MQFVEIFLSQMADQVSASGCLSCSFSPRSEQRRRRAMFLPLIFGAIFVAILIPTAMSGEGSNKTNLIAVGFVSNAVILGVILALRMIAARLTGSPPGR